MEKLLSKNRTIEPSSHLRLPSLRVRWQDFPIVWMTFFTTFIIINIVVKNTTSGNKYVGNRPPRGIANLLYKVFGANALKTGASWLNFAWWIPGVYVEIMRGRMYMLIVFALTILSTLASPYLYYSSSGYTTILVLLHCCSSYTFSSLLGATNAALPFFILQDPTNIVHWAWLFMTNTLVLLTWLDNYPVGLHVFNLLFVWALCLLAIAVSVKRPYILKQHKRKFAALSMLMFVLLFLSFGFKERHKFHTSTAFEGLHHAGPYAMVGTLVILIEIYRMNVGARECKKM